MISHHDCPESWEGIPSTSLLAPPATGAAALNTEPASWVVAFTVSRPLPKLVRSCFHASSTPLPKLARSCFHASSISLPISASSFGARRRLLFFSTGAADILMCSGDAIAQSLYHTPSCQYETFILYCRLKVAWTLPSASPGHADAIGAHAALNFQQHRDQFPAWIVFSRHAQNVRLVQFLALLLRQIPERGSPAPDGASVVSPLIAPRPICT